MDLGGSRAVRRSIILDRMAGAALLTNDLGEFAIVTDSVRVAVEAGVIDQTSDRYLDLHARGLLNAEGPQDGLAAIVRRTRKAFLQEGPSLHIFVVTLRCDHSCQYCQVSRASIGAQGKDMMIEDAMAAVDRVFESDAPALTIEFQGGEPALRFDLVREIVDEVQRRAHTTSKVIRFTMATTLHLMTAEDLSYCRDNGIHLSTSLDGPEVLHSRQRALATRDSWQRTIDGIQRAREVVGHDGVAALPTITRAALSYPEEIVDTYVALGFSSIFLRPLAPYGFARKTRQTLGYSVAEFMPFYERALARILSLNEQGVRIDETMAAIMLRHILTPFHSGYMDLRSPAGAGLGVLVYNYDGSVYPSDEARMAAETGDDRFRLGSVNDGLNDLLASQAMRWLARGAVAETQPDCQRCAFVPYCGADPVHHAIVHGAPDARRAGTDFCERNLKLFQLLFAKIAERQPETMKTLISWALNTDRRDVSPGWIER